MEDCNYLSHCFVHAVKSMLLKMRASFAGEELNLSLAEPGLLESQNHRITESQNHRITESQNHRIVGVGRDLCGSSSPTLLLKQAHLQ